MKPRAGFPGSRPAAVLLFLITLLAAGCCTAPRLPPADLAGPGWRVQQGQAVWKPASHRPELAGDLLLATNANGNAFIQFSKIPFAVATAQISGGQWRIEFGAGKYARQGRGAPPDRFAWFQLPRALLGGRVGGHWKAGRPTAQSWRLENPRTGETLEGAFFQ